MLLSSHGIPGTHYIPYPIMMSIILPQRCIARYQLSVQIVSLSFHQVLQAVSRTASGDGAAPPAQLQHGISGRCSVGTLGHDLGQIIFGVCQLLNCLLQPEWVHDALQGWRWPVCCFDEEQVHCWPPLRQNASIPMGSRTVMKPCHTLHRAGGWEDEFIQDFLVMTRWMTVTTF